MIAFSAIAIAVQTWSALVLACLLQSSLISGQYSNNNNNNNIYKPIYDSRYFKHGSRFNEHQGGTCREFLNLNGLRTCCAQRDDECYMIHYDTRCYCDLFCDRSHLTDNSDCCPDSEQTCQAGPSPPPPRPSPASQRDCVSPVTGQVHRKHGQTYAENCNECRCFNGHAECTRNACLVDPELIQAINSEPSRLWQAANYSKFWAKSLDYGYRHKLGTRIPGRVQQRALLIDPEPIQAHYDFRDEPFMARQRGGGGLIRDQQECGASWAFSAIDVATDRVAKVFEGKRGNETASVQMVLSCAILPANANGCSPASVDVAWKFLESANKDFDGKIVGGLVNEKCYPFESGASGVAAECRVNSNSAKIVCPSDGRVFTKPLLNTGPSYFLRPESSNEIMEEIRSNGPVQVAFKVFSDFFLYKRGVYSKNPRATLANVDSPYHSVKLLGWGTDSESGVDYWLAANSWGADWGEDGYFRIKRDEQDETEFGRYVYAAWGSRAINTKNNKNNLGNKRNRYINIQRRE